jgi:site-specific DNA recombinase
MRTAVYVRVSTQRQSQAQAIDQQLARLQAHLAAQGEALQSEQIFRDDGYSGATLNDIVCKTAFPPVSDLTLKPMGF